MDVSINFVEKMTGNGTTSRHSFVLSEAKSPEQVKEWIGKLVDQYVVVDPGQQKLDKPTVKKESKKERAARESS